MAKKLPILFLVIVFLLVGGYLYYDYSNNQELRNLNNLKEPRKQVKELDGFKLEYAYTGNETWEYLLTTELDNECYDPTVEVYVSDSKPQEVEVSFNATLPSEGECPSKVTKFEKEGTFNAGEDAKVDLQYYIQP